MSEIIIKLEIPEGLDKRIVPLMEKLVRRLLEEMEFSFAREILEESMLTEKQAKELGKEVNSAVAKRHL